MALRGFAGTPRYWFEFNVTLPTVNAGTTAELQVLPAVFNASGARGSLALGHFIAAHPAEAGTGAVAFPASLVCSHAYFKSDGNLYIRFANVTAVNYTAADIVTMHVVGL